MSDITMSTPKARKLGSSTYTPPAPTSFLSFLSSPVDVVKQVVTSKRTHLNVLRVALLAVLGLASLVISGGGFLLMWFSWGKVRGGSYSMDLHYGTPESPPHALVKVSDVARFTENQAYDVFVDLTLPVSRANIDLGNFMVHLSLLPAVPPPAPTGKGKSSSQASQPVAIHSATLPTLLSPLPMLSPRNLLSLVFMTPRKTITLKMLDGVVVVPSSRKTAETTKYVKVWIGREDLWRSLGERGGGKEVVTFGGRVRIEGKLSGIRAILAYFPLSSLVVFTSTSLLTTLSFALVAFYLLSPSSTKVAPPRKAVEGAKREPSDQPTLNLSRAREREWAAQLPRGMGEIIGEGVGMDSSEEERLIKKEEEIEEAEWVRLKTVEAEKVRAEEEREKVKEDDELSSGEETVSGTGARAVHITKEDDDGEDDGRSLLGGSGTTPSHRSWGASTSNSSAASSASSRPSRS